MNEHKGRPYAVLLLAVLFAAAFAPARRATTIDPAAALRVG